MKPFPYVVMDLRTLRQWEFRTLDECKAAVADSAATNRPIIVLHWIELHGCYSVMEQENPTRFMQL